jgi:hypothetical protein
MKVARGQNRHGITPERTYPVLTPPYYEQKADGNGITALQLNVFIWDRLKHERG